MLKSSFANLFILYLYFSSFLPVYFSHIIILINYFTKHLTFNELVHLLLGFHCVKTRSALTRQSPILMQHESCNFQLNLA